MQIAPSKEEKALNQLKFVASEKKGRDKALSILDNKSIVELEDLYSKIDLSGQTVDKKSYFIEVKNREIASTDYQTTILEVSKLKAIVSLAREHKAKAYYFCIYNDGKAYLFDLLKLNIADVEVELKEMNEKTATGNNYKKDKLVYLLPLTLATQTYNY